MLQNYIRLIIIIVSMLVILPSVNAMSNASIYYNLTALWHPQTNLTIDNSTYSYDVTNDSVQFVTGVKQVGYASSYFDGTGSITYKNINSATFNPSEANFTICLWTNITTGAFVNLVSRKDGGQLKHSWAMQVDKATNVIRMQFFQADTVATHATATNAAALVDNTWKQFCGIVNITNTANVFSEYLYINGTLAAAADGTGITASIISIPFHISGDDISDGNITAGIDEVIYVNRSLTSDDILNLYNIGRQGLDFNNSMTPGPPDTTPPAVNITNFNTTIKYGDRLNISCQAFDSATTGNITFNLSGSANLYNFSFSLSGDSANFSQNITMNLTKNNVVNATCWARDSGGNVAQNSTTITIANTIPNATNFVNITGLHRTTNQTINWTASSEPDIETINYVVYWDLDITPAALYYNGTNLNITTNFTSDNTYFFQIKSMDSGSESALSPVFNLTLDTGLPTLTTNCTNNTFTNKNLTCLFSIEDPFPYNITMRVYRAGNNYHAKSNITAVLRFINLTHTLNLTEDGNYTIEINASDSDKTSPIIEDNLKRERKGEAEYVMNDTLNGVSYKMLIRFEDKNENEVATPPDYRSYADYNSRGTHINFGLNTTSNRNGFIPVYDVQTENTNIAILNDTIKGHLVWHPYGVDFEGKLLVNGAERNYRVDVKRLTDSRVKVSIISATDIMNNDVVQFRSESVFGLNVIDVFNTLVIDRTSPVLITALNRTADTNSTSITTDTNVDLTVFIGDVYLDRLNISHNASGSWVNTSFTVTGNKTYILVIQSADLSENEVVGWKFDAFDIAGNTLDPIYTFTVGVGAVATTTTSSGGGSSAGGGSIGATRQCREYAIIYKQCYYFDGINQCLKGCPKGQGCNTTFECTPTNATDTTISLLRIPLDEVTSPISRFFNWVKDLLGLSSKNPELSISGGLSANSEVTPSPPESLSFKDAREKTIQALQQNKRLSYALVGFVIAGFGVYVFGLWQTPLALLMGLGMWSYIIIFILLIIMYLFFKSF